MDKLHFKIIKPKQELNNYVDCFRIANFMGNQVNPQISVCPNGLPGIVFHSGSINYLQTSQGTINNLPRLFLYGQVTELSKMSFKTNDYRTFQVLFKPDALKTLFNIDASTLTNNFVDLQDFENSPPTKLDNARGDDEIINILISFLQNLKTKSQRDTQIAGIIDFIDTNLNQVSVADLTENFYITERQLQKKFQHFIGVSPQLYIRIRRFNTAMRMMDSGDYERLSDVAFALDFHDQSHFIRDIKAFSGKTPRSITQKAAEFYHDQVGATFL